MATTIPNTMGRSALRRAVFAAAAPRTRSRASRAISILAAGALGLGTGASAQTRDAARVTLHVQTRATLAGCLRSTLDGAARPGIAIAIDVTSHPSADAGVDLIVDYADALTGALESGRADEATALTLGRIARGNGRPQTIVAAAVSGGAHRDEAARLLSVLRGPDARAAFARCTGESIVSAESQGAEVVAEADPGGTGEYATAVVDWWVAQCALEGPRKNLSTDPQAVLGAPDAQKLAPDTYSGMMSLGQGGYVTVDMGQSVADRPGPDFRVFQTTSQEPVTLYASDAATGPYVLVAFRRQCGQPLNHIFSGHCDFDLAEAGLASARYLKVEDGELYPCTAGNTQTEGADIDAVEILAPH